MKGAVSRCFRAAGWLACCVSLCSCASFSFSHVTGVKGEPLEADQVEVYNQYPQHYQVVGYVEGSIIGAASMDMEEEELEGKAFYQLKKMAAGIGADGLMVISIAFSSMNWEYDSYDDCIALGWALRVGEEGTTPNEAGKEDAKGSRSGDVEVYIEHPDEFELLGSVSSQVDYDYYVVPFPLLALDVPRTAFGKAIRKLKKETRAMGGNGLVILNVGMWIEDVRGDVVDALLLKERLGEVMYERRFYIISGEAIRTPDN